MPRCAEEFFPASGASGPASSGVPAASLVLIPAFSRVWRRRLLGMPPSRLLPLHAGAGLDWQLKSVSLLIPDSTALKRPSTQPRPPCTSRLLERFAPRTLCFGLWGSDRLTFEQIGMSRGLKQ